MCKRILVALIVMSQVFYSCKKDENNEPAPIEKEVILSEQTQILDATSQASLTAVDTATYTLTFTNASEQIRALSAGNIVVSGIHPHAPYGLMRRVVSVSQDADKTIVTTQPATLHEVLLQGSVHGVSEKMGHASIQRIKLENGVTISPNKSTDLLGFDLDFNKPIGSSATAYGSLYFDMKFNFDLDVSFLAEVDYFKASIEVEQRGVIGVQANGNWNGSTTKIASIEFTPWTIMVGPLPLVFVPQASLMLQADAGEVSTSVETYASEEFSKELGIKYNGEDWSAINDWDPAPTADILWPSLEGDASFTVNCGPRASLKLYGAAGPYFEIFPYASLEASANNHGYDLSYAIGLEANAGVEVSAFGFELLDYNKNLFKKEITSLHLNDQPLPSGLRITSPAYGATVMQNSSITINTTIGGVPSSGVTFLLDGTVLGTCLTSPYHFDWLVTEPGGVHTLRAEAEVDGEQLDHEITITIGTPNWIAVDLGSSVNDNEQLTSVFFVNESEGWVTGKSTGFGNPYGFVIHTTNGGFSWTRQATFEPIQGEYVFGYAWDILMLGPDYGFCTGSFDGGMMQTANGGNNWALQTEFISPDSTNAWLPWPNGICASKENAVLIYDNYTINISTDAGVHWYDENFIQFSEPVLGNITDVEFGEGQTGYLCAYSDVDGSQVYRTTNNGFNWTALNISSFATQFEIRSIATVGTQYCWLAGISTEGEEQAMIWYTTNGGQSWLESSTQQTTVGQDLQTIWFTNETNGFAAGNIVNITGIATSGLLKTDDGGQSWTDVPVSLADPFALINDMYFMGSNNGFAVGYSESSINYTDKPLLLRYSVIPEQSAFIK